MTQATVRVYVGPSLETIRSIVASKFQVKDAFLDPYGVPTIQVAAEPVKEKFKQLLAELAPQKLTALIRGSGNTITIKVVQKPQPGPPRKTINLVLFVATVGTVFVAGFLLWGPLAGVVAPSANPYSKAGEFALGLIAIIGLHEFGHKAATRHHKLDASLPYFIPGPPYLVPFGTFGAVISLREPPANRDQLFDLGLSGPLVGFLVTIIVALLAIVFGLPLSDAQTSQLASQGIVPTGWPNIPLIFVLISSLRGVLRPELGANVLLFSQLDTAAQIGALLTFLNIIPAWQLDGGHISRATFGAEGHRIATIIGIAAMFITQYYGFAILLLLFMTLSRRGISGVEPLDDISPISNSRKLLYIVALATLFLTFSFAPF